MVLPYSNDSTNSKVTAGNTTTVVVAADTGRIGIILSNDSNETLYLAFGSAAVLNQGVPLSPGVALVLDNALLTTQAINVISTSGSKNLAFTEFLYKVTST